MQAAYSKAAQLLESTDYVLYVIDWGVSVFELSIQGPTFPPPI